MNIGNLNNLLKNSPSFRGNPDPAFKLLVEKIMKEFPKISKQMAEMLAKMKL